MSKNKILIIDDNELNRKLAAFSLSKMGYDVILAEDGETGMALAMESGPSLILMDINMEGQDGVETMKMMRKAKELSDIPILAFTALAMKGDKERLLKDGFDGYIAKPVLYNEMMEKIKKLCPLR